MDISVLLLRVITHCLPEGISLMIQSSFNCYSRREFVGGALAAGVSAAIPAKPQRRPNVLYILCDEWRAQALGYAGDKNVQTPSIDQLASQSQNFGNAISGLPVCCPHRASLMTGQYPLTHGVFINDVPLIPKGQTLGEAFAQVGYKTGYIGKWHVYGSPGGKYERRLDYIPKEMRFGFEYWKACECTHEYNQSLYYDGDDKTPKYWPGYDAFAQTDAACEFVTAHAKSADPFFLVMSYGPPHFPYQTAPEEFRAMYEHRTINFRPNVPDDKKKDAQVILRGYYAHIAALDKCVARLLAALDQHNLTEDTIVVFTADHGDMMLSQALTTKMLPWNESLCVPFLLRYPRSFGKKGHEVSLPINSPDIMPTLLGLAGVSIPKSVEGTNFAPMLSGSGKAPNSSFINYPVSFHDARVEGIAPYRGVRTAQHTYVRSLYGPWLLYDNVRDPFQMHNLCGKPEARSVQVELEKELSGWLLRLNDQFLPGEDYVRREHLGNYEEMHTRIGHTSSPWGDWESTIPTDRVGSDGSTGPMEARD
jgi:arylsulfatase A-like enzyme